MVAVQFDGVVAAVGSLAPAADSQGIPLLLLLCSLLLANASPK